MEKGINFLGIHMFHIGFTSWRRRGGGGGGGRRGGILIISYMGISAVKFSCSLAWDMVKKSERFGLVTGTGGN